MLNVLVVGGAGYVGGYVTDLLRKSCNIRVFDNLLYEDTYMKNVDFIRGDILDFNALKPHLMWADSVIWLAAFVGDPACAVNPGLTIDVNVNSVKYLIDNFDGKILFPSTCSVYGAQHGLLTEDSSVAPLSIYAESKLQAEGLLTEHGNAIIFRLGTLFGTSDLFARLRVDLVVNVLTIRAKLERRIQVFGGEQYRPLLHVRDVGEVMAKHLDSPYTGIYNLHSENMSIREIADTICSIVPETNVEFTSTTFQDARNYRVSSKKAASELGFKPNLSVRQGVLELSELVDSGRVTNFANPRFTNAEVIRLRIEANNER
jgi:nucleoside-diphosphate-sugar epimerase